MGIFETERLLVRFLESSDLEGLHEMQSNPEVMQYATGNVKTLTEHEKELANLIAKYEVPNNDFWVYAVVNKESKEFVGTVALIKDGEDDELGYRFIQRYWGLGYASEVCGGLIALAKERSIPKLIGYVVDVNIASSKVLVKYGFTAVGQQLCEDIGLPETKYELIL
jgi:RimJ/RimL family protein N-acetyltransferase